MLFDIGTHTPHVLRPKPKREERKIKVVANLQ